MAVSPLKSAPSPAKPQPVTNPSGINATEFNVVVRPAEVKNYVEIPMPDGTTKKLYKPDNTQTREQVAAVEGEIVHVSPLAFTYERWPEGAAPPKVGDRVVFAKFAGMSHTGKDGVEYRIIKDKDIAAVLE